MARKSLLSQSNRLKITAFLKDYLREVLAEEEYINSFKEAYQEAKRVEVYGSRKFLNQKLISDWLRGLPIGITYCTYNIVCLILNAVTGSPDYEQKKNFLPIDDLVIDDFYWETMGFIIYVEGINEGAELK